MHACDISQGCRSFEVVHEWTYLLFDEFFDQGDLEKSMHLPVSMLCDRVSTNVTGSQPGFISYVTLPLFTTLNNILPGLSQPNGCLENMKRNKETWASYKETEEDKKVYPEKKKPSAAGLTESLKTAFNQLVLQKMDSSPSKHTMGPMSATLKEGKSKLDGGNFTETAEAVLDEK